MFSFYLQSPVLNEYLLLWYMMLYVFPMFCLGQIHICPGQNIGERNKTFMFFYKIFFFFENVSFVFFFIEIDLVFVFRSFYVISPTTDSYIFRILLLSTAERVAWMSLILPCSYESSRQIFLAAAADQSGGTLITGVLPRPWDWFPARVPVRGRHRAVLVVCRARVCIVYFF